MDWNVPYTAITDQLKNALIGPVAEQANTRMGNELEQKKDVK